MCLAMSSPTLGSIKLRCGLIPVELLGTALEMVCVHMRVTRRLRKGNPKQVGCN